MVATSYGELKQTDDLYLDSRWAGISTSARKIHDTARLEPFSVIEDDVEIGENTIIGPFNHIRNGSKIGKNSRIGGHGTLEGNCCIGDYTRLGTHCNIGWDCHIGDYVFIGGNFTGGNDKKMVYMRTTGGNEEFKPFGYRVMKGVRIGLGVTLLPGVVIGYDSLIGAGSLVTHSVPRREIWYGAPAVKRGDVPESEWLVL